MWKWKNQLLVLKRWKTICWNGSISSRNTHVLIEYHVTNMLLLKIVIWSKLTKKRTLYNRFFLRNYRGIAHRRQANRYFHSLITNKCAQPFLSLNMCWNYLFTWAYKNNCEKSNRIMASHSNTQSTCILAGNSFVVH